MKQALVNSFPISIAESLMLNKSKLYIAIGSGLASWDISLPDIDPDATSLVEYRTKAPIADIVYLDDNDAVSSEPTSKIQISSVAFSAEDFEGPVRECGLFLYPTMDNGIMLLHAVFARIDITPQITLTKNLIINLVA